MARNLLNQNCNVTVVSDIDGQLAKMALNIGVKVFSLSEPPGFKLGDGKWGVNTEEGFKVSEENMLYAVAPVNYDVIHIQHKPIAERMCQLYPDIQKVYTVHSEVISIEEPIIHPSIKKYISIRKSISEYINKTINIPIEDISVIYNPIDENRFNIVKSINENYVLFVGSIDYLREKTIRDLVIYTKEKNLELWLVGDSSSNYLSELLNESHVKHFKSTWNIEKYTKKCVETAGIMLGRTTIEGWMCGKGGWIYEVNDKGYILSKEFHSPPSQDELRDKYFGSIVANKIKDEYIKII